MCLINLLYLESKPSKVCNVVCNGSDIKYWIPVAVIETEIPSIYVNVEHFLTECRNFRFMCGKVVDKLIGHYVSTQVLPTCKLLVHSCKPCKLFENEFIKVDVHNVTYYPCVYKLLVFTALPFTRITYVRNRIIVYSTVQYLDTEQLSAIRDITGLRIGVYTYFKYVYRHVPMPMFVRKIIHWVKGFSKYKFAIVFNSEYLYDLYVGRSVPPQVVDELAKLVTPHLESVFIVDDSIIDRLFNKVVKVYK